MRLNEAQLQELLQWALALNVPRSAIVLPDEAVSQESRVRIMRADQATEAAAWLPHLQHILVVNPNQELHRLLRDSCPTHEQVQDPPLGWYERGTRGLQPLNLEDSSLAEESRPLIQLLQNQAALPPAWQYRYCVKLYQQERLPVHWLTTEELKRETRAWKHEQHFQQLLQENLYYRKMTTTRLWRMLLKAQRWHKRLIPDNSLRQRALYKIGRCFKAVARRAKKVWSSLRSDSAEIKLLKAKARHCRGVIVFPPSIPWSTVLFQRPHHLARAWAQAHYLVIYDCSTLAERDCSGPADDFLGLQEIEPNLFLYRGHAESLARLPITLLWLFPYNYHDRDRYLEAQAALYDWIDDLEVFPLDQELMQRNHERALQDAHFFCSVAERLHRQALQHRHDALYLPNAVDYEFFAQEQLEKVDDVEFERLLEKRQIICGYYGALASWFDYHLLKQVAQARPDCLFILIGPDFDQSMLVQHLHDWPNIHWLGPKNYHTLPYYLRHFDVAMIPFKINNITTATSPLKLYEYLAGGKPVITTPMPECQQYDVVTIVRSAEEFAVALDHCLDQALSDDFCRRCQSLAAENSWTARVQRLSAKLEQKP